MIFSGANLDRVLDGTKTQTRRPVRVNVVSGSAVEIACPYKQGRDYAVQPGRTKQAVARIRVRSVSKVPVRPLSEADAVAEGFVSPQGFYDWWQGRYGDLSGECWRIEFVLA